MKKVQKGSLWIMNRHLQCPPHRVVSNERGEIITFSVSQSYGLEDWRQDPNGEDDYGGQVGGWSFRGPVGSFLAKFRQIQEI